MLTYDMGQRGELPLYDFLYRCIRDDIVRGIIAADERLPSKRSLADHLGISIITVEGAYRQLVAEGYVQARERRGYYVCDIPKGLAPRIGGRLATSATHAPTHISAHTETPMLSDGNNWSNTRGGTASSINATNFIDGARSSNTASPFNIASVVDTANANTPSSANDQKYSAVPLADFRGNAAGAGALPYEGWAQATRAVLSEEGANSLLAASSGQGSHRLRQAICAHLRGFRGMDVDPNQILIAAGSQYLYQLIVQLTGRDREIALETPGYPRLQHIYKAMGVHTQPLPLTEEGMSLSALRASTCDTAHVMPSHQFPTGQAMGIAARYDLLSWAAQDAHRLIIEDDYDCEFRLAGRPLPTLASIDTLGQVIYLNTFAKTLGAGLRIGYAVLPVHWMQRYHDQLGFYACTVGALDQLVLAHFMESGAFERHINRLRARYRTVQDALVSALRASSIAPRLRLKSLDAGINFLMGITRVNEEAFAQSASEQGILLDPLSRFNLGISSLISEDIAAINDDAEITNESTSTAWFVMNYTMISIESIPQVVEALERTVSTKG